MKQFKPLLENNKIYISNNGKTKFKDYCGDPLVFYTLENAKCWCDTRNAIDKI